jgi:hypothetical protein
MANGSTPQINRSGETPGPKRLFHSVRDIALIKDKTVDPGYGVILAGTAMGVATVSKNLVPYVPIALAAYGKLCLAPSLGDMSSTADTITIPLSALKRFVVGEKCILVRNNSGNMAYSDGGAIISAAKVNEYSALITFTDALGTDANFTTANYASAFVESDASTPYSTAVYILDKDTDTGVGEDAKGANVSVVISNAILYTTSLIHWDAAAVTDMSAVTDGQHTILK